MQCKTFVKSMQLFVIYTRITEWGSCGVYKKMFHYYSVSILLDLKGTRSIKILPDFLNT